MQKQSAKIYYQGKYCKDIVADIKDRPIDGYDQTTNAVRTVAIYKNGFIFYKIYGDSMYTNGNDIGLIDEKTGVSDTTGKIYIIDDGFLKVSNKNEISHSEHCSDWVSTGLTASGSYGENIGNRLYIITKSEIECYDYKKNEMSTISIDFSGYDEIGTSINMSNNSDYFIYWTRKGRKTDVHFIGKESNVFKVSYTEVIGGEKRELKNPPFYAQSNKAYYMSHRQTPATDYDKPWYIKHEIILACIDSDGYEKTIAVISESFENGYINSWPTDLLVLSMENGAKMYGNGKIITLSNDGELSNIESFSGIKKFDIDVYMNGEKIGTQAFDFEKIKSNNQKHRYVKDKKRKKDAVAIYLTQFQKQNTTSGIDLCECLVLIRDLFQSNRNMAILTSGGYQYEGTPPT